MIEVLILSLIQGVTEFLPISSSSHLIIFSKLTNFQNQSLSLDVSLHIGSFLAVITFFYKDLIELIKNKDLFIKILISSLPVMILGFLLVQTDIISELRNIKVIGWMTLLFGVLLYISDKFNMHKNIESDFTYRSALMIGFLQMVSLVPGVSRSGVTITAARLLKFNRYDAAKISFLLSIPTLAVVSIYGIKNIVSAENMSISFLNLFSILLSFVFSLITIKYFLQYIKSFSLDIFVIYRVILGIVILAFAYL
jgi:undecaprenyl-diphosphatase